MSDLDRRDNQLEAAHAVVELHRKLVVFDRVAFLTELAGSLSNLGKMLYGFGHHDEAVEAYKESVAIYRELAATATAQTHQPLFNEEGMRKVYLVQKDIPDSRRNKSQAISLDRSKKIAAEISRLNRERNMNNSIDIAPLIAPATAAFAYVLDKSAGSIVGKLAVEAATKAWSKVKSRFTSPAALEAVAELEAAPADEDARAAFQVQLKKVLKNDPELAREIADMLQQFGDSAFIGNTQNATAKNGGTVIQVIGGGNKISGI